MEVKKGQVSVFVVVGVIIVALVGGVFFFKSSDDKLKSIDPEVKPLYSFFDECIRESEIKTAEDLGFNGGVYKEERELTWYFYKGESFMPSKEEIESDLSLGVEKDLENCFERLSDGFNDFIVEAGEPTVSSRIEDEKIIFNINYPLTIMKDDNSFTLEDFDSEVEVRMGVAYDTAYRIINDQLDHPETLCMTCWGKFAIENDVYVEAEYYDNSTLVFTIRDENLKLNEKVYEFKFINRY